MSYSKDQAARAVRWKRSTPTLPEPARAAAPYMGKNGHAVTRELDVCLPAEYAPLTLLPEVRERALKLFRELEIPWHAGIDGGPSNHLLSSQVQCANALTQMIDQPERILRAFHDLLGVQDVLEIEPARFLTFEYIGPTDFFGQAPGGERVRGAHCTSVDAAFRHRRADGTVELVLIEWKYTESYRIRSPDPRRDRVREMRYGTAWADPNGPVLNDVLSFVHILDEPFYQSVRQQLLARALEQSQAEGASSVRIVHVLPKANEAYQQSLARDEHRALGSSVSEVWQTLLRRPDRFVSVDSSLFLDPAITSDEYVRRYGSVGEPSESDVNASAADPAAGDV